MNNFEHNFFKKYVPEGQEIKTIIHQHWINVAGDLFMWIMMGVIIPTFLFYYSFAIKELIPFFVLELWLIIIYFKIIYTIFDWYNDVWIITDEGVIDLDRSILKSKMQTVHFHNIEGIEVQEAGIIDKMFKKGDLIIHKIGDDTFVLYDAIMPYKAMNIIESVKQEAEDMIHHHEDKFDVIMDALGGVVETYLEKKGTEDKKYREETDYLEGYESDEGTIDLR